MEENPVRVTIPGDPDALAVIRSVASSLAGRARLSYQGIEETCIAVNEVALLSIGAGKTEVELSFEVSSSGLLCRTSFPNDYEPDPGSMDTTIGLAVLEAMVDEFGWRGPVLSFVKRNGSS